MTIPENWATIDQQSTLDRATIQQIHHSNPHHHSIVNPNPKIFQNTGASISHHPLLSHPSPVTKSVVSSHEESLINTVEESDCDSNDSDSESNSESNDESMSSESGRDKYDPNNSEIFTY